MTLHTANKTNIAPHHNTRENWLEAACSYILDEIIMPEVPLYSFTKPTIKVSLGFPFRNAKAIGQCFIRDVSAQAYNEIFVHPATNDSHTILHILAHELIHAVDNCDSGHRGFFAKTARAIGLEGKLTATHAGEELAKRLNIVIAENGPIPHAAMDVEASSTTKKQTTRMIRINCDECDFTARTSQKWIDRMEEVSACPVCGHTQLRKG